VTNVLISEKINEKTMDQSQYVPTELSLSSPAFLDGGEIPSKYTCDGADINPPLFISGVPVGTRSFALVMDDPDAVKPAGRVWDHWVVWNIPPDTTEIKEGEEPKGIRGRGTDGHLGYRGPCPPDALHTYVFKLYALDTELDLPEGSSKVDLEKAIVGRVLARTELRGTYVWRR
jgi:Raf kinase inhibitor-like YbhB/YbcL family protein